MEKNKKLLFSPLFLKYQDDFDKNPKSRVFAPLAEIYRKVGMTDKAMEILAQGIRYHPAYVMGYLGLAFCYFDLRQYNLAYTTLRPFIEENRDNIRLQKLYADTCLALNKKDEALETLKYLLYINPRDKEIALLVTGLEQEMEGAYLPIHKPIIIPEEPKYTEENFYDDTSFQVEKLASVPKQDFDDWTTLDLGTTAPIELIEPVEQIIEPEPQPQIAAPPVEILQIKPDHSPVVTHTLVDLYCGQGHLEKALEILEKILILNPKDQRTLNKKNEILRLVSPAEVLDDKSEEDGRKQLMDLIDEHVQVEVAPPEKKRDSKLLEKKLHTFLNKIQKRALDYQARI
jgi:tetratricopeptide (TPR) repeat protein